MNPTLRVAALLCIALTACTPAPQPARPSSTASTTDTPAEVRHVIAPQGWEVAGSDRPAARIIQRDGQTLSELSPVHLVPARGTKLAVATPGA